VEGEAGTPVTVASLPARGRPPQAAARRAGLEDVEKILTDAMVALLDGAGCQCTLCVVGQEAGESLLDAWQLLVQRAERLGQLHGAGCDRADPLD
jgi:hypothetical protein